MQVPQWAGPIPMDRSGRLGPRDMSEGLGLGLGHQYSAEPQ